MAGNGSFSKVAAKPAKKVASPRETKGFINWAYDKLSSHPIDRLTQTLSTGKVPPKKEPKKIPSIFGGK